MPIAPHFRENKPIVPPPNLDESERDPQAGNDPGRIDIYVTPYYNWTGPTIELIDLVI